MTSISLTLTARQWATVDACMDNLVSIAVVKGEDVSLPRSIRQAGWDQIPWVGESRLWPPMAQLVTIDLSLEQWQLAVSRLRHDEPVYECLGDAESANLDRDAREAITTQLSARGLSSDQ